MLKLVFPRHHQAKAALSLQADQLEIQHSFDAQDYGGILSSTPSVMPGNHFVHPQVLHKNDRKLLPSYASVPLVQHPRHIPSELRKPLTAQHHQQLQDFMGLASVGSHRYNTAAPLEPFHMQPGQPLVHPCLHIPGSNLSTATVDCNTPLALNTQLVPGMTQLAAPPPGTKAPSVLHPNVQALNHIPLMSGVAPPFVQPSPHCAGNAPHPTTSAELPRPQPRCSATAMSQAVLHTPNWDLQVASSLADTRRGSPSPPEPFAHNVTPPVELKAEIVGKRPSADQFISVAGPGRWDPMMPKTPRGEVDKLAVLSHCANAGQFCDDPSAIFKLACIDMCTVRNTSGPQTAQPGLDQGGHVRVLHFILTLWLVLQSVAFVRPLRLLLTAQCYEFLFWYAVH